MPATLALLRGEDPPGEPQVYDLQAEESQAARSERLGSIIETQRVVVAADLDVGAVMRRICERTQELTHADSATILMLEGEELVIRAGTTFMEGKVGVRLPIEGTLPGWWHLHGRSAIMGDALADPHAGPLARELRVRSAVAVQLQHQDEKAGQLIVISREPDFFTEEDLETLELLSVVLSSAINHAAEFESKRQQVEALARFQTIYQGAAIGITPPPRPVP
jgi:GAF domain-containing protein